jgi:1-aminocyclopropane-1-carboxylate deaminase
VVNPTLGFAKECGMELLFTSRTNMRNYSDTELLHHLEIDPAGAFILPQGGANCLALAGCREVVTETTAQVGHCPDFFITACGTGTTLAGIVTGLEKDCQAIGVSVLKGDFLQNEVEKLLTACAKNSSQDWQMLHDFHFGGYAKWQPELIAFINDFKQKTGIPLDPIYTGKAFFAAMQLAESGFFPEGACIVLVHTGGLQGIAGFNERFGNLVL